MSITAIRFHNGNRMGRYDCEIVRFLDTGDDNPAFVVRFEDGHEAAAYRRELHATADAWREIDAVQAAART